MEKALSNQIKYLVESDKLEKAIHLFKANTDHKSIANELIALESRWNKLQKQIRLDIISTEKANLENNKIVNSFLSLLEQSGEPQAASKNKRTSMFVWAAIAAVGVLAVVFWWLAATVNTETWQAHFDIVRDFEEGKAAVYKNAWGYVNQEGKLIIPLRFAEASDFTNGKARVKENDRYFFINEKGECIENCEKESTDKEGMKVQFEGDNNKAIDARGGNVIINE